MAFTLTSPAFTDGGTIPVDYTCDGAARSPELRWNGEPEGTKTFVLIMHDPDAPGGEFTHWVLYGIPPNVHGLLEGPGVEHPGSAGVNTFDRLGWGAPCPPRCHGPHRYVFQVHALDQDIGRGEPGAGRANVEAEMRGHILATASLTGLYERE